MKHGYVYSLSNNGLLFYIGCTDDVSLRYNQHLAASAKGRSPVNKYIKNMLDNNVFPELYIIDYLPENEAYLKEAQLISLMGKLGHQLTNRQYHNVAWQQYPFKGIKHRSDLAKIIDYRARLYKFTNHNIDENGNKIEKYSPYSPKLKTYDEG